MEDRNGGAIMAIGGVLTVVILGMWAMKFIQVLFDQIGKTAEAFGAMVLSVSGALWALAKIALLGSVAIGSIVAAVYFTYKYILMVKRGTELQKMVTQRIDESHFVMEAKLEDFQKSIESQVNGIRRALHDALKEPEAVPVQVVPTQPSVELLPPAPTTADQSAEAVTPNQQDSNTDMSAVNNPF